MTADKTGRIVWHDLFTSDRQRSMEFYRRIAGWNYATEHATDFAWGGGEKDFVLAMLDGEAGAGFVETPPTLTNGWIAYVEVRDVDAAAVLAEQRGGTILRPPFDVPGVGRNALVRDPLGALIGLSLSRHGFPVPRRQFGVDVYLSNTPKFPERFYSEMFDWKLAASPGGEEKGTSVLGPSGTEVALHLTGDLGDGGAMWVPSLKVQDAAAALRHAQGLGAKSLSHALADRARRHYSVWRDPDGAPLCLPTA